MELSQLAALRAIVETGSFSEAANQLRQTQPAVSHQIRNLEAELGQTLLVRARPRVYPTPAGEAVLTSAHKILNEVNFVLERFPSERRGPISGTIRVAATNLGIVYLFGDLCEEFIKRFPRIEVIFRATETSDEALRRVMAGSADVAFGPLPSDHSQLETLQLGSTEHVFIAGRGHPLARTPRVSPDTLREFPFIRFESGSGSRAESDELFAAHGGYPEIITESNDTEFVKRVVAMGLGIAMVPAFALRYQHGPESLRALKVERIALPKVSFGLMHRGNVQRRSISILEDVCLQMRGPKPAEITAENATEPPFKTACSAD